MSALHRNALLPDALACLRCGEPVRDAEDYCPACDASAFNPDPVRIEAPGWLNAACWVALVVIFVATAAVIGSPVGWLVG